MAIFLVHLSCHEHLLVAPTTSNPQRSTQAFAGLSPQHLHCMAHHHSRRYHQEFRAIQLITLLLHCVNFLRALYHRTKLVMVHLPILGHQLTTLDRYQNQLHSYDHQQSEQFYNQVNSKLYFMI